MQTYIEHLISIEKLKSEDVVILQKQKSANITLDKEYVFLIQTMGKDLKIEYDGKKGELLPRILEMKAINKINSIEVKVEIARGDVIEYYQKRTEEKEYQKKSTTTSLEYTFEGLEKNISYDIKVVVSNEKGEVEQKVTVITNEIPIPEGENISPENWTSENVKITLPTKEEYTTQYSIDTINWIEYKEPFEAIENGSIYYRYTDGTNNGQMKEIEVTNIDRTAPSIELTQTNTQTKEYSKTIQANIQDDKSGIAIKKYAIGNKEISYFAENGIVLTEHTFTISTQSSNDIEKTYTVYAKNNAGIENIKTITIENLLIDNRLSGNFGLYCTGGAQIDTNTGIITLGTTNACQYGPYWNLPAGTYQITYTGSNLPDTKEWYLLYNTSAESDQYDFDEKEWITISGAEVSYKITLPRETKRCEIVLYNRATENVQEIKINSLQIKQLD